MSKHLRVYNQDSQYETYAGSIMTLPNVCHCKSNDNIYYNYDKLLSVTLNVIDDSEPTQLYLYTNLFGVMPIIGAMAIDKIYIDDVEFPISTIDNNEGKYQLSRGIHIIKYKLLKNKNTFIGWETDQTGTVALDVGFSLAGVTAPIINISIPISVTRIESAAFGGTNLSYINIPNNIVSIAGFNNSSLTNITIPNSVITIKSNAFSFCHNLVSVNIPNSVTSIQDSAFRDCTSLVNITIPSSVLSIGPSVFYNCTSLLNVTMESTIPPTLDLDVFEYNPSGRKIYVPVESVNVYKNAEKWSRYANDIVPIGYISPNYEDKIKIEAIFNIEYLGVKVLGNTNNIYDIEINNIIQGDVHTGLYRFSNTGQNTVKYVLIDGTKIDNSTFANVDSMISINIPNCITTIGENAFKSCNGLTNITIPNTISIINKGTFSGCVSLTNITIPNTVKKIDTWAFENCRSLTSITIPSSVTWIDDNAFYGCSALTSVTIPSSVTRIQDNAFYGCSALTSITIPNSVTDIYDNAFRGCSALTSITIPRSVTWIGDSAFKNCSSLISIIIEATIPPYLCQSSFDNNASGRKIYVPAESLNAYKTAPSWSRSPYTSDIEAIPS